MYVKVQNISELMNADAKPQLEELNIKHTSGSYHDPATCSRLLEPSKAAEKVFKAVCKHRCSCLRTARISSQHGALALACDLQHGGIA
jgi:hypothetical protein